MTVAAADRLSDLPDDLLIHILSFAPVREAARTTALSRRWRHRLWLDTCTVNFDYRSYTNGIGGDGVALWRDIIGDSIHAQLAFLRYRGRGGPKKVTLLMRDADDVLCNTEDEEQQSAGVEEEDGGAGVEAEEDSAAFDCVECCNGIEEYRIEWVDYGGTCSMGTLPFAALRVLEITGYILLSDPDVHLAFPFLEAMRLRRCRTELATLQDMISAAPKLAHICLEAVCFIMDEQYEYRIHCLTATVVIMNNCVFIHDFYLGGCSVKLDAPRLRHLVYTQVVAVDTSFSVESPMPHLEEIHLALHSAGVAPQLRSMLGGMQHARVLKMTTYAMADLVDAMPMLPNLEQLEIQELCGWCVPNRRASSAIVNILRHCPTLRVLRLKFRWRGYLRETILDPADQIAAMADFSTCRSIIDVGHDDGHEACCNPWGLHPIFSVWPLECLQTKLRRVLVEFDTEELTCLQVMLVKFLAKNAMVLDDFVVDGGKGYDSSAIDLKVARWRK